MYAWDVVGLPLIFWEKRYPEMICFCFSLPPFLSYILSPSFIYMIIMKKTGADSGEEKKKRKENK